MWCGAKAACQPSARFFGIVVKRAHAAAIGDVTRLVDDIEPLGPSGVREISGITDFVDTERQGIAEALDKVVGDCEALLKILWLGVANMILNVGFHLPFVGRMRFPDVNCQEIGVIFVVVVNFDHVADVAAKGRSSEAAEHEDQRTLAGALAEVEAAGAVKRDEVGVRRVVADAQRSAMHVRQSIANHAIGILGTAGQEAEANERRKNERGQ